MFEMVAPKNLDIFTGTTLKPRCYESKQPQIHTQGKEKEGKRAEDKRRFHTLIVFILPTLETEEHHFQKSR